MGTVWKPANIGSKNCARPPDGLYLANPWWSMSRPRGSSRMSFPVKMAIRRSAPSWGRSSRASRKMLCGLPIAIFVPAPVSPRSTRGGGFVLRARQGLPWEMGSPRRSCARTPTGQLAQQRVCVVDEQGHKHLFRRLQITLAQATRDGDMFLYILTNLPCQVSAQHVAQL